MGAAKARHESKCGQAKETEAQSADAASRVRQKGGRADTGWNKMHK
jgi:hypothetical protein